jgi:hypothetical protein
MQDRHRHISHTVWIHVMLGSIWLIGCNKCWVLKGYGPLTFIATVRTIFTVHFSPLSLIPVFYFYSRYCLSSVVFHPPSLSLPITSLHCDTQTDGIVSLISVLLYFSHHILGVCAKQRHKQPPANPLYLCLQYSLILKNIVLVEMISKFAILLDVTLCILKGIYRRFRNQMIGEFRNVAITFQVVPREL